MTPLTTIPQTHIITFNTAHYAASESAISTTFYATIISPLVTTINAAYYATIELAIITTFNAAIFSAIITAIFSALFSTIESTVFSTIIDSDTFTTHRSTYNATIESAI